MEQPDTATLRLVLGFVGVLSSLVMLILRQAAGKGDGLGQWLMAALLSAAAYLMPPAVRWTRPELGIAVNSGLTLSAMLLMLDGVLALRRFGDGERRRPAVAMLCLGILALMLVSAGQSWLRVVLHDGLACLLLSGTATALVWRAPRWSWPAVGGLASLFMGLALLFLWRGSGLVATGLDLGGADTRTPPWLLLATLVWAIGWSALYPALVLTSERERSRLLVEKDMLTGLASRKAFLRQARLQSAQPVGLLLVGVEGLRPLNGSLGHEAGDRLLIAFASRLQETVGPAILVGRLTGAQFAVLLPEVRDRATLMAAAGRLRSALSLPLVMGDLAQTAEFSLGAALAPEDGRAVESLLDAAERSMFRVRATQMSG